MAAAETTLKQDAAAVKRYSDSLLNYDDKNLVTQELGSFLNSFSGDSGHLNELSHALSNLHGQQMFQELQKSHAVLDHLSSEHHECSKVLDYGVSRQKALFEKCCGLKFKLTEDHAVTLEFQHLVSSTVCSITLDINTEGQWEVIQLSPQVPGVTDILDVLNHNKNLTQFCKQMRLKFKDHCSS